MPTKKFKPTTPSRRYMTVSDFSSITKTKPTKSLTRSLKKHAGRGQKGNITVRHQGGGHKRLYRDVDFKRQRFDDPAKVLSIEYDPNRSAFISLILYNDGTKGYILAAADMKVEDEVVSSQKKIEVRPGNRMSLKFLPVGTNVYNVELIAGRGGQIVKSAGATAEVMAREGGMVQLKLPSGEVRNVSENCLGTIGVVSNGEHENIVIGKAGRQRWLGIRPSVRGKAMNPVDHPHGGGEGRAPIGLKNPKTPWGKPALGVPTRKFKKASNKFIIKSRKKGRRK